MSSSSESFASFSSVSTPSSFAYSEDLSDSSCDPDDFNRAETNDQVLGYTVFGRELQKKPQEPGAQLDNFMRLQKDPSLLFREIVDPKTQKTKTISDDDYRALNALITTNQPLSGIDVRDQPHLKYLSETFPMAMKTDVVGSKAAFTKIHEYKRALLFRKLIAENKLDPNDPTGYKLKKKLLEQKSTQITNIWNKNIEFDQFQLNFIIPPKIDLPTTSQSYNPPAEFNKPIPKSLRTLIPDTTSLWLDRFNRQLDLYLAPRQIKKQSNSLNSEQFLQLNQRVQQANLKPFPTFCDMTIRGNLGKINTVDVSPCGKFLATGGKDGILRVYELETGKLLKQVILIKYKQLSESLNKYYYHEVNSVKFSKNLDVSIIACACANQVVFVDYGIVQKAAKTRKFLNINADSVKTQPGWVWECLQGTVCYKNGESVILEDKTIDDEENVKFEEFQKTISKDYETHRKSLEKLDKRLVSLKYQNNKQNLPDRVSLYADLNSEILLRIHGPEIINSVDFNENGNYLLTTSTISQRASNVTVHRVSHGITQIPFNKAYQVQKSMFSGSKIIISEQKNAFSYDLKQMQKVQKFDCRQGQILSSAVCNNNVVFGHSNGGISFFGLGSDGFCESKNSFFRVPVNVVKVNAAGLIAAGGADGVILILRIFDYQIQSCQVLRGHGIKNQVGITDLVWFGDNLVSCAGDGTVKIWR